MTPTAEDIISASGFHPSRVFCIYIFGSRVYGTSNEKSDWDIIMVANNSVEATELCGLKKGIYNIHVYTPNKFQEDLDWHRINNLECIFAPDWAKLKEDRNWELKFDSAKLRHATSHISSNSWVKAKKKLLQGDYYQGIKSLFHSIRIPMFATQIATTGKITDFSCANFVWDKIKSKVWTWEELDKEFGSLNNQVLTEFRKVASK
jgi:predicted nucleotidyltransferase